MFVMIFWTGLILGLLFGLVYGCQQIPFVKASNKLHEQREIEHRTPHVIREVDGCKVYEFEANGHFHYFTRCPKDTTTDTTIEERHGKRTENDIETQTTENY